MANVKAQLASIAKALVDLSKRVEKVSQQVEKLKAAPAKKATAKKATAKKKTAPKAAAAKKMTVLEKVYEVIRRSRNGANIAKLREKTKLESRQLSNALYKLTKKGKIKSKSRGVYIKS